ncbi:hypothetical protein EBL87_15330 [Cereibacter sphaeroides]|nr:hypothetical protein EBL87_15330 [Cereibacter sphaeroides]AZB67071.1 hypothetical protein EBL86_01080 [Cereibacter sphaeroides]
MNLLEPDAQPHQPYAWLTNQAAHSAVVGLPLGLLALGLSIPPEAVPPAVALIYLIVWERLIQRGPDLRDSLTDTAHVAAGATLITAALSWGYWPTVGVLAVWATMLAAGIWRRTWKPFRED